MNAPRPAGASGANAALTASAMVLAGLIVLGASRMGPGAAEANMVASSGAYTALTTEGGNDEVLLILNNRDETLSVYRVDNQNVLEFYRRYDLPVIFADARARALGQR